MQDKNKDTFWTHFILVYFHFDDTAINLTLLGRIMASDLHTRHLYLFMLITNNYESN